jgi:Na+/H+-dicarboxylate symporter/ABC-type amino acid transport substrate-binding protein
MPSRSTQTILGILLGLAIGLFFGEDVRFFGLFASAFIGLLQMAALPFVVCSIIYSFGSLSAGDLWRLSKAAFPILVALWLIGLVAIGMFSAALPSISFGSFFSASLVQSAPPLDWVRLFIPSNVFNALDENLVPAVVVFSVLFGVALSHVTDNRLLLEQFRAARDTLIKVNGFVARIIPIGTFFVVGFAAGTIPFDNVALLQAYVIYNAIGAILIAVVVLPALISVVTPHSFWSVVSASREALLTVFVVGNTFVVIPMIAETVRKLDAELGEQEAGDAAEPGYLVSLGYPLPDIGKIFAMFFVPFAAWFYGLAPDIMEWAGFYAAIVPVAFAKTTAAVPALLDVMRVPADAMQLFFSVGVLAGRFGDLMQTMHLITFAVVTNCALRNRLRLQIRPLTSSVVGLAIGFAGLLFTLNAYIAYVASTAPPRSPLLLNRTLTVEAVPFQVYRDRDDLPEGTAVSQNGKLSALRNRAVVRVGYDEDELPFTFFNSNGDLVGFDIDMAHRLAADLGVDIDFVPFEHSTLLGQLQSGEIDIAMAGLEGTPERAMSNRLADSYLDVTMALVVPDHRRKNFSSLEQIAEIDDLKVAVIENGFFDEVASIQFPAAKIVVLPSESVFFAETPPADALLTSAEIGSAWTLLKPEFSVAAPFGDSTKVPLFYLSGEDAEFEEFLEVWIELQEKGGTIARLYDYWILGKDPKNRRWSLRKDVLNW